MQIQRLIIDGYSLIHRDPEMASILHRSLSMARQRLIRRLEEVSGSLADHITVVFDGTAAGPGEGHEASAVEVLFSPSDKTADTIIERMTSRHEDPTQILVVTSDRAERETVGAAGAQTMSCGDFLDLLKNHRRQVKYQSKTTRGSTPGPTLGDFFPKTGGE